MQTISRNELKTMDDSHKDFVLANVLEPEQFNKEPICTSVNA